MSKVDKLFDKFLGDGTSTNSMQWSAEIPKKKST